MVNLNKQLALCNSPVDNKLFSSQTRLKPGYKSNIKPNRSKEKLFKNNSISKGIKQNKKKSQVLTNSRFYNISDATSDNLYSSNNFEVFSSRNTHENVDNQDETIPKMLDLYVCWHES